MYFLRNNKGFSLIEMLVVIAIAGVLAAIAYASFDESRKQSRDKIRMAQLQELQVAIELYKDKNGRYPVAGCATNPFNQPGTQLMPYWAGPGPFSTVSPHNWGRECDNYIEGLAPEFIDKLPLDPSKENEGGTGYMYTVDAAGTRYKVIAHNVVEALFVADESNPLARCPSNCSTAGIGTICQTRIPTNQYAIYSNGAECW